jgi:DNA-binding NarL/FixJ family response regulator
MKPITVLLADDHAVVRDGLAALLEVEADIHIVGQADTGREAVRLVKTLLPDVVVMDIAMPLLNGLEAARQILKAVPATRILILSAHSDDEYVDEVIRIGAAGYLIKQSSAHDLAKAIRHAHSGKTFFSPTIAARQSDRTEDSRLGTKGWHKAGSVRLTSREVEILQLIAEGKANKNTADELGISIKTVEKHRQNLMTKLEIHDTAGLTRYAIAAGLIESGVKFIVE